jgi:hypothetical protein
MARNCSGLVLVACSMKRSRRITVPFPQRHFVAICSADSPSMQYHRKTVSGEGFLRIS